MKTIRGMLPKQSGEVLFFDKPMEEYTDRDLAREVAYLQQQVEVAWLHWPGHCYGGTLSLS